MLTVAALELNRTDNKQVVKVAGVVRRLRNWYRKLTDPEYRAKVMKLQNDSVAVKGDIDELEKYISEVHKSIKDSDVESYNFAVDRVREISKRLVGELVKYEQSAKAADPDVQNQFTEQYPKLPASLDRIERVHISNKIREAVWNIRGLKEALMRHNLPQDKIDAFINNHDQLEEFYNTLAKEIKAGKIVGSWISPQSAMDINRNGEMQYRIITNPFIIPGTSFQIQVTVEGTDLSARTKSPRPVFSVHKFNFIDARQKSATRLEQLGTLTGQNLEMIKLHGNLNNFIAKLSHKIEVGK